MYLLLSLQYDGYDYAGWAKQPHVANTIQGALEQAFYNLSHQWVWTLGASKTDAQVHARDQRVLVRTEFNIQNLALYQLSLNRVLPHNIKVNWLTTTHERFNVRSVRQKHYVYCMNDSPVVDVFHNRYTRYVRQPIDVEQLQTIMQLFVGTHDFFHFSGVKTREAIDTIRTISQITVVRNPHTNDVEIHVYGPSFIRYQIRMIVENGWNCYLGKISAEQIKNYLQPGTKTTTNYCAPGYGLCLRQIDAE